mgnify:CR=1 FL=1
MLRIKRLNKMADSNLLFEIFLNDIKLGDIKNDDTVIYDLKDGDYNLYIKCNDMISDKIYFSYDDHTTIEFECYPKYNNYNVVRSFYKTVMNKKGLELKKVKDFYV